MLSADHRSLAVAAAVAVTLVPAAVAGTSTLTHAQVIERASVICRAAEHRVEATPAPRSQNPFAKTAPTGDRERALEFIAVYASSLTTVRVGLSKLVPLAPRNGRALLASFVAELQPTIQAFHAGRAAAVEHRDARALADVKRGFALFARASTKTRAYGFPKGVCQAGS